MTLNINCCENINFQRILCKCFCEDKSSSKGQVVYTDRNEQIVILSTPHIELPELVFYNDIQHTDVAIFSMDENHEIRFTSLQGQHLFDSIDTTTTGEEPAKEHKSHPSITKAQDVAGRLMKDVLPDYMLKFLLPICTQTLQGSFLQLTVMWRGMSQLIRTYPILDYKRRIIAGMLTISPFTNAFNADVNRFSVGNISDNGNNGNSGNSGNSGNPTTLCHEQTPVKRNSNPENITPQTME